jgi:hypothetical protein
MTGSAACATVRAGGCGQEGVVVLRLLCSEPEPGEYGIVVTVGEYISRPAARIEQPYYVDTVEWRFD